MFSCFLAAAWHTAKQALPAFLLAALLTVSALHTLSGLSRDAANLVLAALRALLYGAFVACNAASAPRGQHPLTADQHGILDSIPRDVRTVLRTLNLEPEVTRYAAC
ncbi:uncharacterized protein C8Q71DRAFT_717899, partial [Rhodofomes roseus]